MGVFVADGQPYESPGAAAELDYGSLPVSNIAAVPSIVEGNLPSSLGRRAEVSAAEEWADPSDPMRLARAARTGGGPDLEASRPPGRYPAPPPAPLMDPQEAQKAYAPPGSDRKLFDKPVAPAVAAVIGAQEGDRIQRESILSRWQASHGTVTQFGVGLAASLLDPLNDAAMFVPGIGEETVLAQLGRAGLSTTSLTSRLAARAVAGGVSADIGTLPIVGLNAAMARSEGQDYGVRDAMRDLAFNATIGALFHAGTGIISSRWRRGIPTDLPSVAPEDAETRGPELVPPSVDPQTVDQAQALANSPASDTHARMRAAVAQTMDGREVSVPAALWSRDDGLPPPGPGHVRFYHGSLDTPPFNEPRWLAQDYAYARDFRSFGTPKNVSYVDLPADHSILADKESFDRTGTNMPARYVHFEAPVEIARDLKAVPAPERPQVSELGNELRRILDDPEIRAISADPPIDRTHQVLYGAGASKEGYLTHVDESIPAEATFQRASGAGEVTIDPAKAVALHEQVEKIGMERLLARGMDREQAYETSHHLFAEPAERRWVEAHDVKWEDYQAWWKPRLDAIEKRGATNTPPNLYDKPYPHEQVKSAGAKVDGRVKWPSKGEEGAAAALAGPGEGVSGGQDILGFLRSIGGLKRHPELDAIGAPSSILRQSGATLDYAREAAAEAGYFPKYGSPTDAVAHSTPADLLDLIDYASRGERHYAAGDERQGISQYRARRDIEDSVVGFLRENELDETDKDLVRRMVRLIERGEEKDPESALERAALQSVGDEFTRDELATVAKSIPGFDEHVAGSASPGGGEVGGDGSERAREGGAAPASGFPSPAVGEAPRSITLDISEGTTITGGDFADVRKNGQKIAGVAFRVDGNTLHVDNISAGVSQRSRENIGAVGTQTMREVLRAFRERYPQVTEITGYRVSGARSGASRDIRASIPRTPAELATEQADIYRNGYAPGIPQNDFDEMNEAVYGKAAEQAAIEPAERPKPAAGGEAATAGHPLDAEIARLESEMAGVPLAPDELAIMSESKAMVSASDVAAEAYAQAGACLAEAGV